MAGPERVREAVSGIDRAKCGKHGSSELVCGNRERMIQKTPVHGQQTFLLGLDRQHCRNILD